MKLEAEVIDLTFLDEKFNLSLLSHIYNQLVEIQQQMNKEKQIYITRGMLRDAAEVEEKLYYINSNIHNVEVVMLSKESDLFEFEQYDLICKN